MVPGHLTTLEAGGVACNIDEGVTVHIVGVLAVEDVNHDVVVEGVLARQSDMFGSLPP